MQPTIWKPAAAEKHNKRFFSESSDGLIDGTRRFAKTGLGYITGGKVTQRGLFVRFFRRRTTVGPERRAAGNRADLCRGKHRRRR